MGRVDQDSEGKLGVGSAILRAAAMALVFAANAWLLIETSKPTGGIAAVWSANAILMFALMGEGRRAAIAYGLGAFLASIVINALAGFPVDRVIAYSIANVFEAGFAAWLFARIAGERWSHFSPRNLVRFSGVSLGATLLSASIATAGMNEGAWAHWVSWFLSDLVGMLLLVPALSTLRDQWRARAAGGIPRRKQTPALAYGMVLAVTLSVFAQGNGFWMFAIAVPILFAVFAAGRMGAVISIAMVAVTAVLATQSGIGPIAAQGQSSTEGILFLQSFLACQLLISFPVASILELRERDAANALEGERRLRDQAQAAGRQAERVNRAMALAAARDSLTGLLTRARTFQRFEHRILRAMRRNEPLTILLFDIDHFKDVNDRFGHLEGDDVLVRTSNIARSVLPRRFEVGRIGGEEFLAILHGQTVTDAMVYAELLRLAVMRDSAVDSPCGVTISIGLADFKRDSTVRSMIIAADSALYHAKSQGRNQSRKAA